MPSGNVTVTVTVVPADASALFAVPPTTVIGQVRTRLTAEIMTFSAGITKVAVYSSILVNSTAGFPDQVIIVLDKSKEVSVEVTVTTSPRHAVVLLAVQL